MRPEVSLWRKHRRAAEKGVPRGRRTTHKVETQQPHQNDPWWPSWKRLTAGGA